VGVVIKVFKPGISGKSNTFLGIGYLENLDFWGFFFPSLIYLDLFSAFFSSQYSISYLFKAFSLKATPVFVQNGQ